MILHMLLFASIVGSGSPYIKDNPATVRLETGTPSLFTAPLRSGGRVEKTVDEGKIVYRSQWPGVYFETSFTGTAVDFQLGRGDGIFHVLVDGQPVTKLVKPLQGLYTIEGLTPGQHVARIEIASENQNAPIDFGGFFAERSEYASAPQALSRSIEFIGDSHTVGYGDTSLTRQCTPEEVWLKTDTSQAFGPLIAKHYNADYRINAISGRGLVRNYNGFKADSLPQSYSFMLFDKKEPAPDTGWRPQVVVIALGTNDFSTGLNPGEKWKSREELHADYEKTYVGFVQDLRTKYPEAFFILGAPEVANGELQREVHNVIDQLKAAHETRLAFAAFDQLELTACDGHPSLADHKRVAQIIIDTIDAQKAVWSKK
jgi:lysophospholipase L1-like esterase